MVNVVILKMLNGEEVLVRKDGDKYYKARVIQVIPGKDGKAQATLAPYITLAPDTEFTINMNTVVAEVPCPTEVEKSYIQATSAIALL